MRHGRTPPSTTPPASGSSTSPPFVALAAAALLGGGVALGGAFGVGAFAGTTTTVVEQAVASATGSAVPASTSGGLSVNEIYKRSGPGVVQITWAAGVLPPMIGEPAVSLNSGPGMAWAAWIPNNANGVEVHTTDATGQPFDQRFVVSIF